MSKAIQPVLEQLFFNEKQSEPVLVFTWLLIRRRRRAFLLLPVRTMAVRVSLELYSAQRRRAKIWRAMMPLLLNTPLAVAFQRIQFSAPVGSEILRFLSEQSGVTADQLGAPAIKFGGLENHKSRLVLLACDQTNRPVKVIKLGLDDEGREATEREADLLEKLPPNTLGCIRMTGRLTTPKLSAFATAYFPGGSPEDDAGMEILFHSWINPEPAMPIESLDAWRELETEVASGNPAAWRALCAALAGKNIRSTLHHGDFAPWNIRAINSQNLQAFDWERGNLRGVPGWDWFHFVAQTAMLARRHSVERVAAEVEALLQSPRFEKYAAETGISGIVKPLLLAYLLHHRWVVKPQEGAQGTEDLHALLAQRWGFAPQPQAAAGQPDGGRNPAPVPGTTGFWADACGQLKSAWTQLANVFWEPTLTANIQPSAGAQFQAAWPLALGCSLMLGALACAQYFLLGHEMLLPFYAVAALLATWKISRRWGTWFAVAAAWIGPLVAAAKDPGFRHADLICWNALMCFLILQMCVFLTDRIRRQKDFFRRLTSPPRRSANFADNWAVVLVSGLWFFVIAWGDFLTGPRVIFLPLYLFPAILITLFLNLRWGALMVLLGAFIASADEYVTKFNASIAEVFGWNFPMRFLVLFVVILLLNRFC